VDDDVRAVEHVAKRLEQAGLSVTRTYGGAEALEALAVGGFSAIVLDLMMPISGFEVLRELRANPATVDLPVVILTAKVLEPSERAMLEKSVVDIVLKEEWTEGRFLQQVRASIQKQSRRSRGLSSALNEPPRITGPTKRILVIDDDPHARDLFRLYLEDAGFAVMTVESAEEGLDKFDHFKPDLITLDLTMPGLDGLSFLTAYADSDLLRGVPVLVVSSSEGPEKALAVGAQAVLAKPIRRHEFLQVVQNLVANPMGHRPYVMVVDDDPKAVKVVTSYFSDSAVDVGCAYGGQEALDSIKKRRPDLVILDLQMPKVSGYDVLIALRANPETATLPVVILSAKELTAQDRKILSETVQLTLAKASTSSGDLLERVWELLGVNAATRAKGGRG
jgi:CheY-like chemotaxis protein